MIVDTSVIVAVIRDEPEGRAFLRLIATAPVVRISAATYLELAIVIDGMRDPVMSGTMDAFIAESRMIVVPLTAVQARIARTAHQQFGRGSGHPARLNMGDCFAYALARDLGEPLLFKGGDFSLTDIEIVTEPIKDRRLSEVMASYGAGAP